jgi:hypothetical protein
MLQTIQRGGLVSVFGEDPKNSEGDEQTRAGQVCQALNSLSFYLILFEHFAQLQFPPFCGHLKSSQSCGGVQPGAWTRLCVQGLSTLASTWPSCVQQGFHAFAWNWQGPVSWFHGCCPKWS